MVLNYVTYMIMQNSRMTKISQYYMTTKRRQTFLIKYRL